MQFSVKRRKCWRKVRVCEENITESFPYTKTLQKLYRTHGKVPEFCLDWSKWWWWGLWQSQRYVNYIFKTRYNHFEIPLCPYKSISLDSRFVWSFKNFDYERFKPIDYRTQADSLSISGQSYLCAFKKLINFPDYDTLVTRRQAKVRQYVWTNTFKLPPTRSDFLLTTPH